MFQLLIFLSFLNPILTHPFIWPNTLVDYFGNAHIFAYNFQNETLKSANYFCGDLPLIAIDGGTYELTWLEELIRVEVLKISVSSCGHHKKLQLEINGIEHSFSLPAYNGLIIDVINSMSFISEECPTSNQYMLFTSPCLTSHPACHSWFVCDGLLLANPQSSINKGNSSEFMYKDKRCHPVPVYLIHGKCVNEKALSKELKVDPDNSITWCKIQSAKIEGSYKIVTVPYQHNGRVCLSSNLGIDKKTECKTAWAGEANFKVGINTKHLSVQCGDSEKTVYNTEKKDIDCPMFSFSKTLSALMCKSAWRPIFFWLSISWLIFGMPAAWSLVKVAFWIKRKNHMKLLRNVKQSSLCKFCNQKIYTAIDSENHRNCDLNKCPFCSCVRANRQDFINHVVRCGERSSFEDKIETLLKYEEASFDRMFNATRLYTTKKFRLSWIILFLFLFFLMFIPSVTAYRRDSHCEWSIDREQRSVSDLCKEHHENRACWRHFDHISIDNSHAPGADERDEELSIDKRFEIITKALASRFDEFTTRIMGNLDSLKRSIINKDIQIERKIIDVLETILAKPNCSDHEEVDIGSYVGQMPAYVRIHVDDKFTLMNVIDNFNKKELRSTGTHEIHAGPDAAVQVGADHQHQQGGSGGGNVFGLGSSTNVKAESFPVDKQDQDDFKEVAPKSSKSADSVSQFERRIYHAINHRERNLKKRSIDKLTADDIAEKIAKSKHAFDIANEQPDEVVIPIVKKASKVNLKEGTINQIETQFNLAETVLKTTRRNAHINPHNKWFQFEDHGKVVCPKNCLHEPDTCQCLDKHLPNSQIFQVPWASIKFDDIHFLVNPNVFQSTSMTMESESETELIYKTEVSGELDVHEGSFLSYKLVDEKTPVNPILTITIPSLSQVYSTNFLYYTCERKFDTEVKGLCTGECEDYCKGRICLGSRIWKWDNCRSWTCNPSWCASIASGCCCCGSNVHCDLDSKIGALWEVKYLKTEYIVCIIFNSKLQNCKLVDSTTDLQFGDINLGVSRLLDPVDKLPKHVFTVHETSLFGKKKSSAIVTDPDDAYLEPNVCTSEASCSHGFIGDVQVMNLSCLYSLGKACFQDHSHLDKTKCASSVYVNHANTKMRMTCHFSHHHTCNHENSVPRLKFDDHLTSSKKLSEGFNIKKFKVDLNNNELLMYVNPKAISGTLSFKISYPGLILPKHTSMPVVDDITINECHGCYSCKLGFSCTVTLEMSNADKILVTIRSKMPEIEFSLSPIELTKGTNLITIKGVAYSYVPDVSFCVQFGDRCLKKIAAKISLREPSGQFVPAYKDLLGETVDEDDTANCSGLDFFKCIWISMEKVGEGIYHFITSHIYTFVTFCLVLVMLMFLPQLILVISRFMYLCKKSKKTRYVYSGRKVQEVYKDVVEKMKKEEKNSDEESSVEFKPLLSARGDTV